MVYFGLFWNSTSISLKITCNYNPETTQSYEQSQDTSIPSVPVLNISTLIAKSLEKTPETTPKSSEEFKLKSNNKYGDVGYEHVKWKATYTIWNSSSCSAQYVKEDLNKST